MALNIDASPEGCQACHQTEANHLQTKRDSNYFVCHGLGRNSLPSTWEKAAVQSQGGHGAEWVQCHLLPFLSWSSQRDECHAPKQVAGENLLITNLHNKKNGKRLSSEQTDTLCPPFKVFWRCLCKQVCLVSLDTGEGPFQTEPSLHRCIAGVRIHSRHQMPPSSKE